MAVKDYQRLLAAMGYDIAADGMFGPKTRDATLRALTDGPDTPITADDVTSAADLLAVSPAHIWTIRDVETTASSFVDGRPTILFEGHRFCRATGGRYNDRYPAISYPNWDRSKYPRTQAERYRQLLDAVQLDIDAGFASASYGGFQILGENFRTCGYDSPAEFAFSESWSEGRQLTAFVNFVHRTPGLEAALRACDWPAFARKYNGPAYAENRYAERLADAFRRRKHGG